MIAFGLLTIYAAIATYGWWRSSGIADAALQLHAADTEHAAWCAKARLHYSADCTCRRGAR